MNRKIIYFDNNATSQIILEVLDEMYPYLNNYYGNPSSSYPFGLDVKKKIEKSRQQVAALIHAKSDEIVFTSGATESNNTAFMSCIRAFPKKKHIITTMVEHSSIMATTEYLSQNGYEISYIPVDAMGRLNFEVLDNMICDATLMVSIMYVNNEIGNIYPIEKISNIVKNKNKEVLFHTDAVQAIGKIDIDVNKVNVDFLSLSGHKFHAPKGVGALFLKEGTPFIPLLFGGHQEKGYRAGTENSASIIGLGKAAEIASKNKQENENTVRELRDYLESTIISNIEEAYIYGDIENRVTNTTNIGFEGIKGEEILIHLAQKGICASTGSACNSVSLESSYVLEAMGIPSSRIRSIRFSLSKLNDKTDVDYLIDNLLNTIKKLKNVKEKRKNVCIN